MSLATSTWFANIDHKWEINRKQKRIGKRTNEKNLEGLTSILQQSIALHDAKRYINMQQIQIRYGIWKSTKVDV